MSIMSHTEMMRLSLSKMVRTLLKPYGVYIPVLPGLLTIFGAELSGFTFLGRFGDITSVHLLLRISSF